jgi:hypothetical protein
VTSFNDENISHKLAVVKDLKFLSRSSFNKVLLGRRISFDLCVSHGNSQSGKSLQEMSSIYRLISLLSHISYKFSGGLCSLGEK